MKALDTNVVVRYLVQDDPNQSRIATRFVERECSGDNPCFIGHIVLCELAWVLESNYGLSRQNIAGVIERLLQVGQLQVMDSQIVWQALEDYKKSKVDFPDHLLARVNHTKGCDTTVTFDKNAGKQPLFELLQ